MARNFDDASSEYLSNGNPPLTASPVTIGAWFQTDDLTVTQIIASIGASGSTHQYSLIAAGAAAGDPLRATVTNSSGTVTGFTGAITSGWHSGLAVFSSDTVANAYLDGTTTAGGVGFGGSVSGIDRIYIGRRANNGVANYFSGDIAEVAVWAATFTADDIAAHAAGVRALNIRPDKLVFYCPMIGDSSSEPEYFGARDMAPSGIGIGISVHPRRIG